jgi:hypothetical protein
MKKQITLLIILMSITFLFAHESDLVFRSNTVSEIRITIDPAVLAWIYDPDNVQSDSLHPATITFHNENLDVSLDNVGFRLRGNTSRTAAKKSFKLDFNEFIKGQEIAGIQKFNLKGEQNDPSLIRSKIAFELFEKIGVPASLVCYTTVYINDVYYGLYENIEHIDDCFLAYHIGDDSGNLWKCLWPADLNYLGPNPSDYHPWIDDEKPYELKTNKEAYDYSDLAHLIDVINNTPSAQIKDSLESLMRVTNVIKYLAVNIMTGSWDDYRYLRNNYYLYHNPSEGKFHFIPYDYDNTFGIDWVGGSNWGEPNWTRINMYSYDANDSGGRPLSDIIFDTPEYRNLFTHFMDFYTNQVFREDQWTSYADSIKAIIRPFVENDIYYPQDHGFTISDFDNSYNTDYRNSHVERGLYEFMRKRRQQTNLDLNWQSSLPSIYHQEIDRVGDSAIIHASVFSHDGIKSVSLVTYNSNKELLLTSPMTRDRILGTSLVEKFDQWTSGLNLSGNEAYYRIFAVNSFDAQQVWPRSGYAEFKQIGSSDIALYINEFMASNDTSFSDQDDDFDDWIEIYNASDEAIDLSGMFLTDKPDNLVKWQIPFGTSIDASGFLLFWCDEDEEQIGLHTNFKLSGGGEFIALSENDGLSIIDSLTYGDQNTDISYGRTEDGGSAWQTFTSPTPGYSNLQTGIDELIPLSTVLYPNYPNPFNPRTAISFQLSAFSHVDLSIYNLNGQKLTTLVNGNNEAGTYRTNWNANSYASGVYLAVLSLDNKVFATQKMLYIK